MGLARFLGCLLWALVTTAFSRILHGALLPSWSFGYEVITRAQKRFNASLAALPPLEQRRLWGALRATSPALRAVNRREETLGGVATLFFEPKSGFGETIVLYLHGGSFIYGSEGSHGDLAARVALASGARVAFPLYRLAPEHPFPAALEDATRVFAALAERHGAKNLVVAGDSAGGNLVLSLLLARKARGESLPRAAVPISPWVDLAATGGSLERNARYDWAEPEMFETWARTYLSHDEDRRRPDVSPAHGDLVGLPPLLVLVGGAELLVDQVTAFAERAKRSGVPVTLRLADDMTHLWIAHAPMFPTFQADIERIGAFVRESAAAPS